MTSGATKIEKAALSKKDDTVTIRKDEAVNLRLDILAGGGLEKSLTVDFVIKVA